MRNIIFLKFNIKVHDDSSIYEDNNSTLDCWIKSENFEGAISIVEKSVIEYNWKILECIESEIISIDKINTERDKEIYKNTIEKGEYYILNIKPQKKT